MEELESNKYTRVLEKSIINICYGYNAFEAIDFTWWPQAWCSTFQFFAGILYILRIKLQLKYVRNNTTFTLLMFQNNLLCIFVDFQQKWMTNVSNYLLVDSVDVCACVCFNILIEQQRRKQRNFSCNNHTTFITK